MPRIRVVSRAYDGLKITAYCVDVVEEKPFDYIFYIPSLPSQKHIEKYCHKYIDSISTRFCFIRSAIPCRFKAVMNEENFLKNSIITEDYNNGNQE